MYQEVHFMCVNFLGLYARTQKSWNQLNHRYFSMFYHVLRQYHFLSTHQVFWVLLIFPEKTSFIQCSDIPAVVVLTFNTDSSLALVSKPLFFKFWVFFRSFYITLNTSTSFVYSCLCCHHVTNNGGAIISAYYQYHLIKALKLNIGTGVKMNISADMIGQ